MVLKRSDFEFFDPGSAGVQVRKEGDRGARKLKASAPVRPAVCSGFLAVGRGGATCAEKKGAENGERRRRSGKLPYSRGVVVVRCE